MLAIELADLDPLWEGHYLLLWRAPTKDFYLVQEGDRGRAVAWLKERLARVDGIRGPASSDLRSSWQ